jgi:hypothetical protein
MMMMMIMMLVNEKVENRRCAVSRKDLCKW